MILSCSTQPHDPNPHDLLRRTRRHVCSFPQRPSIVDELANLREKGLLSASEFLTAKAKLLGQPGLFSAASSAVGNANWPTVNYGDGSIAAHIKLPEVKH